MDWTHCAGAHTQGTKAKRVTRGNGGRQNTFFQDLLVVCGEDDTVVWSGNANNSCPAERWRDITACPTMPCLPWRSPHAPAAWTTPRLQQTTWKMTVREVLLSRGSYTLQTIYGPWIQFKCVWETRPHTQEILEHTGMGVPLRGSRVLTGGDAPPTGSRNIWGFKNHCIKVSCSCH